MKDTTRRLLIANIADTCSRMLENAAELDAAFARDCPQLESARALLRSSRTRDESRRSQRRPGPLSCCDGVSVDRRRGSSVRRHRVGWSLFERSSAWSAMTPTLYTCADCGGTFDTCQPDEVAQQEALEVFGKRGDAPGMAIVCDDCYRQIMSVVDAARRRPMDLTVYAFTISQVDVDELNGQVAELEREIAKRIAEELERDMLQLLLHGTAPMAPDGRPLVGISPLQPDTGPGRFGFVRTDLN
jgi:hypothetical protein